ncbi:hypothetical protein DFJ74DRAFT_768570 [Hyaloraphidium curvatum]|nr:hypothetical protein DFJ74DRAFT_768570 [Hyaloraphidium curvatum]
MPAGAARLPDSRESASAATADPAAHADDNSGLDILASVSARSLMDGKGTSRRSGVRGKTGAVAVAGDGAPRCADRSDALAGSSDFCQGRLILCKKLDGNWRCKRHYDRLLTKAPNGAAEEEEEDELAGQIDEELPLAAPPVEEEEVLPAGAPYDSAAGAYYYQEEGYEVAADGYVPDFSHQYLHGDEHGEEDEGYMDLDPDGEVTPEAAVVDFEHHPLAGRVSGRAKAPKKPRNKAEKKEGASLFRKNSVKAQCRPIHDQPQCLARDCYGEWEAVNGRYRVPVHYVTVTERNKSMVVSDYKEIKHLTGCDLVTLLFPVPGTLRCNQCGTTFSTSFNANSHAMCRDNHFRCAPCGKGVTTLAAIQKHFKTPSHRARMDGWTVDGVLKSKAELDRMHDHALEFASSRERVEKPPRSESSGRGRGRGRGRPRGSGRGKKSAVDG